jgi:hypothetical protein
MPILIPDEFKLGHDLAFGLHDLLVEHVVLGEQSKLQFFSMQFKCPEDAQSLEGVQQGEDFWNWCEANGYRHVLDEHTYRSLAFALLSDMCHFLYEGLKCSEKGKLAVAFSDFRKPFQDNLFYLEWMLADRPGFLSCFQTGPEHIDTSKLGEQRKARRLEIIGKAMDQTQMGRWVDPEWLYELRYEKASEFSLDKIFNHATHLVTTYKHYATSPENMNFIFQNDDDRQGMWRYLYLTLPMVLMHALFVVRALFKTFAPDFKPHDAFTDLWLLCGLLLSSQDIGVTRQRDTAAALFNEFLTDIPLDCPRCKATVELTDTNMRRFWDRGDIRCQACNFFIQIVEPSHVAIYDVHAPLGIRVRNWFVNLWSRHTSS